MKEIEIAYDNVTLEFSEQNLKTMINAFNEVSLEIEEWEFETRMGITNPEADEITEFLKRCCRNIQKQKELTDLWGHNLNE
jgi:hypothetical protein